MQKQKIQEVHKIEMWLKTDAFSSGIIFSKFDRQYWCHFPMWRCTVLANRNKVLLLLLQTKNRQHWLTEIVLSLIKTMSSFAKQNIVIFRDHNKQLSQKKKNNVIFRWNSAEISQCPLSAWHCRIDKRKWYHIPKGHEKIRQRKWLASFSKTIHNFNMVHVRTEWWRMSSYGPCVNY